MSDLPRAIVYVDGFNFYYAAFRGKHSRAPRLKWLDISEFSRLLLPGHDVQLVRYFTAAVKPVEWDPSQHLRQGAYLRALASLPEVSVHKGNFARWKVRRPLVNAPPGGPQMALVWDTKEKARNWLLQTRYFFRKLLKLSSTMLPCRAKGKKPVTSLNFIPAMNPRSRR